ncbi:MAG: hypothetical protein LBS26_02745 [Campylobacteraceae bacterium]|jgi:hypothetical protein|nr:hypothetical protein [Campylobacteraceae bacterium]
MRILFIPVIAVLCVLGAAEHINAQEAKQVKTVKTTASLNQLVDKVWECYSYIRAFKTDIKLSSHDIYYANKVYEIQPVISVKVPAIYSSEVTIDDAIRGLWRIENSTFITEAANGNERDTASIMELTDNRFITKSPNGLVRTCKAKVMTFDPDILTANTWKCTFKEEFDTPNTYIQMESINRYSYNGTSKVDGVIKLKFDPLQPEFSYSIVYGEKWSYENGRFKTQTEDVKIKNIMSNNSSPEAFEEMLSLENVFKKGTVDEMEVLSFAEDSFILQDLSSLGVDRSKYSCKRISNR